MDVLAAKAHLAPDEIDELLALVAAVESSTGHPPLSDQSRLALQRHGEQPDGCLAVVPIRDDHELVGFAQVSPSSGGWTLDTVWAGHEQPSDDLLADVVRAALGELATSRGSDGDAGRITWWRDGDTTGAVESTLGFELDRELLQMRRPLPVDPAAPGSTVTISTRSFVPAADEDAFLTVNNRAFADHHEQSGWTHETVASREAESWFDPDGFLLLELDDRLAGFCWTKVHPADGHDDALGEIYVIAVDPDFAGRGLGKQLTLAGLDHLARIGITTAMLYVDADNVSAVAMYDRLGFHVHSSTKAFSRRLRPTDATSLPSSAIQKDQRSS
ncbi:MAG: mycothiol synthase [Ilumatobacteraceae bacterium]